MKEIIFFIIFIILLIAYIIWSCFDEKEARMSILIVVIFFLGMITNTIDSFNDDIRLDYCKEIFGENYTVNSHSMFDKTPTRCQTKLNDTTIVKTIKESPDYYLIGIFFIGLVLSFIINIIREIKQHNKNRK